MELFLLILVLISTSLAVVSMMSVRELAKEVDKLDSLVKHNDEDNAYILNITKAALQRNTELMEFNSKLIKELENNKNT